MVAADHMSSVHIPTHAVSLEVSHPFGFYSEVNISARPTNRIPVPTVLLTAKEITET